MSEKFVLNGSTFLLEKAKKWDIDSFDTADKIGTELSRLHSEKEKHLEADDMPSAYFENIDSHINSLNKKMENFKCKCEEITESRLPKDGSNPEFGIPEEEKYPLFDEAHVRSAIKLFGHVEPEYEAQLARAIKSKMKKYNIPTDFVGENNPLAKYLTESGGEQMEHKKIINDRNMLLTEKDYVRKTNTDGTRGTYLVDKNDKHTVETTYGEKRPLNDAGEVIDANDLDESVLTEGWRGFLAKLARGGSKFRWIDVSNCDRGDVEIAYAESRNYLKKLLKSASKNNVADPEELGHFCGWLDGHLKVAENLYKTHKLEEMRKAVYKLDALIALITNSDENIKYYDSSKGQTAKDVETPLKESTEPGINTEVLNNTRADIQDELTAIKNYDSHADFAEDRGFFDIADILRDIRDEEKVHVGELQKVLSKYDSQFDTSIEHGGEEAAEKLSEELENWEDMDSKKRDEYKKDGSIFLLGGKTHVISPDGHARPVGKAANEKLDESILSESTEAKKYSTLIDIIGFWKIVSNLSWKQIYHCDEDILPSNKYQPKVLLSSSDVIALNKDNGKYYLFYHDCIPYPQREVIMDRPLKESILSESILDPTQKTRCQEIFDENDKMLDSVKEHIKKSFQFWYDQLNPEQKTFDILNYKMIGSSTGFNYTARSDMDIQVNVKMHDSIPFEETWKLIKILPNGHNLPGTLHPINYYMVDEKNPTDLNKVENMYDIESGTWEKKSDKPEISVPSEYIREITRFLTDGFDLLLGRFDRDKQYLEDAYSLDPEKQEISEKEKADEIVRRTTQLQADIDALWLAEHLIHGFRLEAYNDNNPFHILINYMSDDPRHSTNELIYKTLDKFEYRERLKQKAKEGYSFLEEHKEKEEVVEENSIADLFDGI